MFFFIEKIRGKKEIFWIKKKLRSFKTMRMHSSKRRWINLLAHNLKFICYFQKFVHSVTTEGKTIAHAPEQRYVFQTWLNIQCLVCDYWDILNDIDTDILNRCVCGCLTCRAMDIRFVYLFFLDKISYF